MPATTGRVPFLRRLDDAVKRDEQACGELSHEVNAAYWPRVDAVTRVLEAHQYQDPAVAAALRDRLDLHSPPTSDKPHSAGDACIDNRRARLPVCSQFTFARNRRSMRLIYSARRV